MIRQIARPLLASVYVVDGVDTLVNTREHIKSTESVLKKIRKALPKGVAGYVPNDPELVARAVGGTKVGAGSLLAIGKAPRFAAGTLAVVAVPTIIGRYAFWETDDAEEKSSRRSGFLTNTALVGGLAITSMDTQGKPGLAWRAKKGAQGLNQNVQSALPSQNQAESGLNKAGNWIGEKSNQAQDAVTTFVDDNKDDWKKSADQAAGTANNWIESARQTSRGLIGTVQQEGPRWVRQAQSQGRDWLNEAQDTAQKTGKRAVKAADKAQTRADKAINQASSKAQKSDNGKKLNRGARRAMRKAEDLQKQADKSIQKAARKMEK